MKANSSLKQSLRKRRASPSVSAENAGFTLIELLVVVAIGAILLGLAVSAFKSPGQREASVNQMTQALDEARVNAIGSGTRVYLGFADATYPDESKRLRGYILFRDFRPDEIEAAAAKGAAPDTNTFVALTPWMMLPKGFYVDDQARSSLLQEAKAQLANPKGLNIPDGTAVTLYVIVFDSLGQVVQPQGINPCLTVVAGRYAATTGLVPISPRESSAYLASAFSVEVSRLTGRTQYQNGLPPPAN